MKISVIIPAKNEQEQLAKLLPSLASLEEPVEVILSTPSGDDSSLAAVDGSPWHFVKVVQGQSGRGVQLNRGAALAGGDVLLFLHADTKLPDGWQQMVADVMLPPDVVGGAFNLCFDSRTPSFRRLAAIANFRSRYLGLPYGDQAIFCRRSSFDALGGYMEWGIMEDVDFYRRLSRVGVVKMVDAAVITSARRYARLGIWLTALRNFCLLSLYLLGVPPSFIARFYS